MCGGAALNFIHPHFPNRALRGEQTPFELSSEYTAFASPKLTRAKESLNIKLAKPSGKSFKN